MNKQCAYSQAVEIQGSVKESKCVNFHDITFGDDDDGAKDGVFSDKSLTALLHSACGISDFAH